MFVATYESVHRTREVIRNAKSYTPPDAQHYVKHKRSLRIIIISENVFARLDGTIIIITRRFKNVRVKSILSRDLRGPIVRYLCKKHATRVIYFSKRRRRRHVLFRRVHSVPRPNTDRRFGRGRRWKKKDDRAIRKSQ